MMTNTNAADFAADSTDSLRAELTRRFEKRPVDRFTMKTAASLSQFSDAEIRAELVRRCFGR